MALSFNFHVPFKPLVSLQVHLKLNADVQIASCIDTFQILFITTFHRQIL